MAHDVKKLEQRRLAALRHVAEDLALPRSQVRELRALEDYDIVFLIDDAGSMERSMTNPSEVFAKSMRNSEGSGSHDDAFAPRYSRWDFTADVVRDVVRLAVALDTDGVTVRFPNRDGRGGLTQISQLKAVFAAPPAGGKGSLAKNVKAIVKHHSENSEKPLLLVVATDAHTRERREELLKAVRKKASHEAVISILACTDDPKALAALRKLTAQTANVDVIEPLLTPPANLSKSMTESGKKGKTPAGAANNKAVAGKTRGGLVDSPTNEGLGSPGEYLGRVLLGPVRRRVVAEGSEDGSGSAS